MQFIVDDVIEDKVDYESLTKDLELMKSLDNAEFRRLIFVENEEEKQRVHECWHIPLEDIIINTRYREGKNNGK